jgi:ubiquinone/menaquinone biosynthesis C-methylase UbiE
MVACHNGGRVTRRRISETDHGITGEFNTQAYDQMMRRLRDKGWMETDLIIKEGISAGLALEVGPGPGYLGLEWLKKTENTNLRGLDISENMIAIAQRNAAEYGLTDRVKYVKGDARKMPLEDEYFDAVFSNGSLHEWAQPVEILNEIARVLKPGGRYLISDLRRDMNPIMKWFLWIMTGPREMRSGLVSSINASYKLPEAEELLQQTSLQGWQARKNFLGIVISGRKSL